MSKKATDILSYCTWIGWLIAFLAGDRENSKHHLNQGLALALIQIVGGIVIGIVTKILPILGILSCILSVACLILAILGIIAAANGEEKDLPILSSIKILK